MTPVQKWTPRINPPPHLLLFGALGTIPDLRPKAKLQSRSRPARFLAHTNRREVLILLPDTYTTAHARLVDFRPLHYALDPSTSLARAFRCDHPHLILQSITNTTDPPCNPKQAQLYPDAHLWAIAHNTEIEQLNEQHAIEWLNPVDTPPDCEPIRPTIFYRYKHEADGTTSARKSRCSVRGDLMRPNVHFDPSKTSSYAADRASIRLILALAAVNAHPLSHIYITSAFTSETYDYYRPVYVRQTLNFYGTLTYPDRPIGVLRLTLYGSRPTSHIYFCR